MYRVSAVYFLVIITNFQVTSQPLPEGFVLSVSHDCGTSVKDNTPLISIMTDLSGAGAVAHCKNGDYKFLTEDGIYMDLYPSFLPSQYYCVFNRLNNTNTYVVNVTVFWGNMEESIDTDNREYIITCNFDKKGSEHSPEHEMANPVIAPKEIAHHLGDKTTSKLSLDLVDVRDNVLKGKVRHGRYVRLIATADGKNKEVGIKPVSCDAVGRPSGVRHAILRAGCGDGSIFNKSEGFITKGNKAFSPYFGAFKVNGDKSIDFECNMTLCFKDCDGSSCHSARRRRSGQSEELPNRRGTEIFIRTKSFECIEGDDKPVVEFGKNKDLPVLVKSMMLKMDGLKAGFVTKQQLWILMSVLGFLVLLALLASLYNCYRETPKDSNASNSDPPTCPCELCTCDDPHPCEKPCSCKEPCDCPKPCPCVTPPTAIRAIATTCYPNDVSLNKL